MESIKSNFELFLDQNASKLPLGIRLLKEISKADKIKVSTNSMNKCSIYPVGHFYKPISQIKVNHD